ncbi:uncharacterized protein LOC128875146 isoform X1 [Hylaeus volcanicus]|uniref:uncharacterized protein LOC128875146 isoform X1 n=1 Tax=Hylaeus volcanicus TaxID=313075 RepID=UPI0023B7DF97|nr:uncharacterized protein LOC128875146 isoform X1 [Hylaeus volcanicus]XP_053976490.1 uncharacterized protein LOC128875146 isoform X1 [Hylaeus volcanicus]
MVNLELYKLKLEEIKQYARENNISESEIQKTLENSFHVHKMRQKKYNASYCLKIMILVIFIIIVCFASINWKFLVIMTMRNLQNSIYPMLKLLRKTAMPIIHHYPSLSEFYDEWCILENPYFYVNDIDCWPCSVVHFVPDLTGHQISRSFNPGIPYIKSESLPEVRMKNIEQLYWENYEVFEKDAMKIFSNNLTYRNIRDVMESKMDLNLSENLDNHVMWRINRMRAGRILRKLFPKPESVPVWWEQSTEKFIFFDEQKSPSYSLPHPECSNVVVRCTTGARLIKMISSPECSGSCKSFTVLLSAGKTLWYNWWYWRPISLSVLNSTSVSINYMTSFC